MKFKNFTYRLLIASFLLPGCAAIAQPIVAGSAFPSAGDVFTLTLADTAGVNAGAGGAAATWSFASLNPNGHTQVDSFMAPSATPYGSLFPLADIAQHERKRTMRIS